MTQKYYMPTDFELTQMRDRASFYRREREKVFGRSAMFALPSIAELACESSATYRNCMDLIMAWQH